MFYFTAEEFNPPQVSRTHIFSAARLQDETIQFLKISNQIEGVTPINTRPHGIKKKTPRISGIEGKVGLEPLARL